MHKQSGLRRGCVFGAFLVTLGAPKGGHPQKSGSLLAIIFDQKSKKWYPKRHPKINAETVSKNDAKRLQNDAKMDAKIFDFSCFFEKGENARNHCIYELKRGSGHVKSDEISM